MNNWRMEWFIGQKLFGKMPKLWLGCEIVFWREFFPDDFFAQYTNTDIRKKSEKINENLVEWQKCCSMKIFVRRIFYPINFCPVRFAANTEKPLVRLRLSRLSKKK